MPENSLAASASSPDTWVDRHGDLLFRFALLRVGDRQIAEDMVQETLLSALKDRKRFRGRSSEQTWLVGILKHKIMDHYRRNFREKGGTGEAGTQADEIKDFDAQGHWTSASGDWGEMPDALVESKEFWSALHGCLEQLPQRTRSAFAMVELDEAGSKTVCKALGITATNLWVLLHRARHRLRQCLEVKWFDRKKG